MSIEKSAPNTPAQKAAARPQAQGAKAAAGNACADGSAQGFMAILGALGDSAPADAATPALLAPDAPQPAAATAAPDAFDVTALLQQNPQIAAAQAQQVAANAAAATGTAAVAQAPAAPAAPLLQAATVQPALASPLAAPGAAAVPGPQQDGARDADAPARRGGTPVATAGSAPAAKAVPAELQAVDGASTQSLQQHAAAHAKPGKDGALAAADSTAANNAAAASGERTEARDAKLMAAVEQARAPQAARAAEPLFAPLLAKPEKTQGERLAAGVKGAEPGYAGTALGVSTPDTSLSGLQGAAPTPEMQVAEQVTYWVSQNVQNAELKLDGLGHSPVEVSIHVQGNEAQISFRSDEAATRDMLEGASAHLKDMLQREGLVLTGVSVGNSGAGSDTNGSQQRARQAARQGLIAPVQVATVTAADTQRRMHSGAGRSVDLFV